MLSLCEQAPNFLNMKNFTCLLRSGLVVLAVLLTATSFGGWGIFHTRATFDTGQGNSGRHGGVVWLAQNDRQLNDHDFGVFRSGDTFILRGGDVFTWKDGGDDVCGAEMFYRIYPLGDPPPAFIFVNLPFGENQPSPSTNPNDQRWGTNALTVDVLQNLSDGEYVIEFYWLANGGNCGFPDQQFDSNSGNNFAGTFRVNNASGVIYKIEGAGETKTGYASGTVNLSGAPWVLSEALIGTALADKLNGSRALRLKKETGSEGLAELQQDRVDGVGTIGFNYARYGDDVNQPNLFVEYSVNGGAWTQAGATISSYPEQLTWWEEEINASGNVRVRFRTNTSGTNNRRINIDDILLTDNICVRESFDNIPTTSSTSYLTRTWTGDNGGSWEATQTRTDLSLNGLAATLQQSGTPTIAAPATTDGIGVIRFNAVRGFGNTNARSVRVFVNGEQIGSDIVISPTSDTPESFEVTANVSGNAQLSIQNIGSQVTIDDVSWTCYTAPLITDAVSESEFILSDCAATAAGTVSFTTNTFFGGSNTFTAQLSDATGDFSQPLAIGTGSSSPISITIPAQLPTGTGYRIRVVSSDPAFTGTESAAFTITQNGTNCDVPGDFRTRGSGSYAADAIWQTYTYNPTTQSFEWQNTNDSPDDAFVNVTIRDTHTVFLGSSNLSVNNLIVEAGGQLYRNNTACGQLRYLSIAGDIICNGTIGNGTTLDAIGFNFLAGSHTISGTGTFDAFRMRLASAGSTVNGTLGSASLNIEMNVTLRWYEGTCSGGRNAIYNDRGATSMFDVTIASGAKLTLTGAEATFGMDGANSAPAVFPGAQMGGGYTVFGTIEAAGAGVIGSNNASAQQVYLDIRDGGNAIVNHLEFGDNNGTDGGRLDMEDGATLEINGVASGASSFTDTTEGSILFNIDAGATILFAHSNDQEVPGFIEYGSVLLTGNGERIFTDLTTVVKGDLTYQTDITIIGDDPEFVIELGGDWNNNGGTFQAADGTVVFSGAAAQTIGGSTTTFHNITMDGAGIDLAVNTDLIGVLAPEAGDFDGQTSDLRLISDENGTASIGEIKPTATYAGNTIIERYIPSGVQNWVNLASPIAGLTLETWNDFLITTGFTGSDFPGNSFNNVLTYDETVPGHRNQGFVETTNVTNALDATYGYFVYMQGGTQHVTVEGNIQQGALTTTLDFTNGGAGIEEDGWNLVANRYPSEISWDELHTLSSNISDTYYIYDAEMASYTLYSTAGGGTSIGPATGFIPSSQSFWVQATASGAELSFAESIKSADGTPFERNFGVTPLIHLSFTNGDRTHDTKILFEEDREFGFEPGRDAPYMASQTASAPQVATVAPEGQKLSINRMNLPQGSITIPVHIRAAAAGAYTLNVEEVSELPQSVCLIITDLLSGEVYPLETGVDFTWTQEEAYVGDRFLITATLPMEASAVMAECAGTASGAINVDLFASEGTIALETLDGDVLQTLQANGQQVVFEGLTAGDYRVVYSAEGLVCEGTVVELYVEEPAAVNPIVSEAIAYCNALGEGSIEVSGFNGVYTATLLLDGVLIAEQTAEGVITFNGLDAELYEVQLVNTCINNVIAADLTDPNAISEELFIESLYVIEAGVAQVAAEVVVSGNALVSWFINGNLVAEGNLLQIELDEEGTYAYEVVINGEFCEKTLTGTFSVESVNNLNELDATDLLLMNAPGEWMLTGRSVTGQLNIDVYGANGALIRREAMSAEGLLRIENEQLARGMYTIVVLDQRGDYLGTFKALR